MPGLLIRPARDGTAWRESKVIEEGPQGCLVPWPRGSLKQWLAALGTVALLLAIFYALFSMVL